MTPKRLRMLVVGCLLTGLTSTAMLAQDKLDTDEATDKIEDVVEKRADDENAAEKKAGKEVGDADIGEASYNTEDCAPIDTEGDGQDDADADATDAVDGCEKVVK